MNKALALIGFAKQSAKGTAATAPVFGHGVTGGQVMTAEIEQGRDEVTTGLRSAVDVVRESAAVGVDFSTRAFPKGLGLLLYAVMGAIAVSGSGPYVHVITLGDVLAYLTFFGKYSGEFVSVQDCKIDELAIEWEGAGPLEVNVTAAGTLPGWPTAFSPTNDESKASGFKAAGGTFTLDVDGTTLAASKIMGGSVKVSNKLESDQLSASVVIDDVHEGVAECEASFKIRIANLTAEWRTLLTGTASGTAVSQVPIYGSFSHTFVSGTDQLVIAGTRVPFLCDFPEADPAGGPVELELAGTPVTPSAGTTPLTFTLTNGIVSYTA